MTNNQLRYREALEKERSNKANEQIKLKELNETIRKNNLQHSIDLDKNEITKLYNYQLNSRELAKLEEEMNLAYDKLNESAFVNSANIGLANAKNRLEASIANAKNDTEIQKALLNGFSDLINGLGKIFKLTNFSQPRNAGEAYAIIQLLNGNGTISDVQLLDLWPDQTGGIEIVPNQPGSTRRRGSTMIPQDNGTPRQETAGTRVTYSDVNPRRQQYYERKNREPNEIPTDKSNSYGPGSSREFAITVPSINNGPGVSSKSKHDYESPNGPGTSGGTDYHVSGGHKSSGTIITPGVNL